MVDVTFTAADCRKVGLIEEYTALIVRWESMPDASRSIIMRMHTCDSDWTAKRRTLESGSPAQKRAQRSWSKAWQALLDLWMGDRPALRYSSARDDLAAELASRQLKARISPRPSASYTWATSCPLCGWGRIEGKSMASAVCPKCDGVPTEAAVLIREGRAMFRRVPPALSAALAAVQRDLT